MLLFGGEFVEFPGAIAVGDPPGVQRGAVEQVGDLVVELLGGGLGGDPVGIVGRLVTEGDDAKHPFERYRGWCHCWVTCRPSGCSACW